MPRPLGPIVWCALVVGAAGIARGLERDIEVQGFQDVDPARVRLESGWSWVDPRWEEEVAHTLARHPAFRVDDSIARGALLAEVTALSFVAEAGPPEVLWPDGLRVPIRFRTPIACVSVGGDFRPVAADGTLLSGTWPTPPRIGPGWLPVIGPVDGTFDHATAGQVLTADSHLDALSVAAALWTHLEGEDLAALGRIVIDATRAADTSAAEPGIRLLLEEGRAVWFGRAPRSPEPGGLPVARKLTSLSKSLAYLRQDDESVDWELVDLRWDRPEMRLFPED